MKPTYGRISRYGLVAFASSLDQIGPMTRNVLENAKLLNILVGEDNKDLTSAKKDKEDFARKINTSVKGLRVAVPNYFMSDIVSNEIREGIKNVIKYLEENGVVVDYMI